MFPFEQNYRDCNKNVVFIIPVHTGNTKLFAICYVHERRFIRTKKKKMLQNIYIGRYNTNLFLYTQIYASFTSRLLLFFRLFLFLFFFLERKFTRLSFLHEKKYIYTFTLMLIPTHTHTLFIYIYIVLVILLLLLLLF